jgi:uncharacterized membrane protein
MGKVKLINQDFADLLFLFLFCLTFIALGGEHLVKDDLIQKLMPSWVPLPKIVSIGCGLILLLGGGLIALAHNLRFAPILLGTFLIIVTTIVHGSPILINPDFINP